MSGDELPEGWAEVRIAEVCAVNPRDDHLDDEVDVTFVPMAAVSEVTGMIERPEVRKTRDVRKGFTTFLDDDVIFAKITPCMENGKSAVARGLRSGRGYGSTEFVVLRSKGGVNPSFLHRFVRQEVYRRDARATMQSGVGQARVPKQFIENTVLMLPPLPEQGRIVARLDALQARSRGARDALAQAPALLDAFRQSVLAAAFRGELTAEWRGKNPGVEPASALLERVGAERRRRWDEANPGKKFVVPEPLDGAGLPELPAGWAWARLSDLANVGTGATPNRGQARFWTKGTIPWVTSGVVNLVEVTEAAECVTDTALTECNLTVYEPGTLLMAMYGEGKTRGLCTELKLRACTNQALAAIVLDPVGEGLRQYLRAYLRSVYERTRGAAAGGVQPNLNLSHIRAILVPVAPAQEAELLLETTSRVLDLHHRLAADVSKMLVELDILDQAMLARAFRGELVEQDPDDEPAEVLLARLRGDAAEGTTPARRARRKGVRSEKRPRVEAR